MSDLLPREAFRVVEPIAVRWGDMDAYEHVNNAAFLTYCESARITYFETVDLFDHVDDKNGPVVVEVRCAFLRQVHYPANLEVGAKASQIGRSSFTLEYGIFDTADGDRVAEGSSVVVWIDRKAGRSHSLPTSLVERIRALDLS
ncbi:MAG: thioesterase family protein [Acidobacteriota bacterium]